MSLRIPTEFSRAYGELGALLRRDITQGIKLAKYKKIAKSMLKKDPVFAESLMGLISCLEHDIPSMHSHHLAAIDYGQSCLSLMYYAISLQKSCLWGEAVKYGLLALDREPGDAKLLDAVIAIAPLTGRFSLLKRLLGQWQEAHEGVAHPSHAHYRMVTDALAAHGLVEKDLKDVLAGVGGALAETDVILEHYHYELHPVREGKVIVHYRFVLPDQLVASYYEDLVCSRLDSLVCHPRIYDVFSFSVENSTIYQLYDCMEKELVDSADTIRVPDPEKMKLIEELVAGVEIRPW